MLKMQASFAGSFDLDCKVRSMPHSLPVMVVMILNGPNFKSQGCDGVSQASITIVQLLQCHISVRQWPGSIGVYHQNTIETPLPIYAGLVVHARTRKRDLIETLFDLGLSISYDRVMEISTTIGNHVCNYYQQNEVVCPPNLREGLFITAVIDNIDHNPSSTTATDALHGIGISLFQHPRNYGDGYERR